MVDTVGNSRSITTNQVGTHDNLEKIVTKHLATDLQKPFSQHTLDAFEQAQDWIAGWQGELILDACCGVGESTAYLAQQYPNAKVIGVDKSLVRTNRHELHAQGADNLLVLRADLNDFWRLAVQAEWPISQHYLLYPNPYPKSAHVKRRWHASPALKSIVALGGQLTVRSNWRIYIEEFALALSVAGFQTSVNPYHADEPMTPFERKYWASGQQSWQLVCQL